MSVKDTYVAVHKQGWLPIFVDDGFDAVFLADVCVEGGCSVIETTCRRPNVLEEIKRIKQQHPSLKILVGSTVDSDRFVSFLNDKGKEFPSLDVLADIGVDGFVSLFPFLDQTLEKYRNTHFLMPGVETVGEAYKAVDKGAHFAKLFAAAIHGGADYVRHFCTAPTHKLLPLFVTGGVTTQRIPEYLTAGAVLLGGGWDLMLGDEYNGLRERNKRETLVNALKKFRDVFHDARRLLCPHFYEALDETDETYLAAIHHYHPFRKGS